jgi:NADH-quinone oxidoreductase subunit H
MDFLNDPVGFLAQLLRDALAGLPPVVVDAILAIIGVVVVATFCLLLPLFLIWAERRLVARMQDRVGPNRVGPEGLLQTIADAIKLMIKEDITPIGADKIVYNFAPILAVISVITMWAVIPFAVNIIGTDLNVAALYIVSVGSLGTLAIMLGGWASNNKYALLGAFRTVAQLVCYEVPLILSLIVPVLLARSMSLQQIIQEQDVWFIFMAPVAALVFFITSVAETGRAPFDLLEAESEIVAGFHIEYSGMKFGMFFVAEFLHAFTVGALTATLFLGGWRGPFAQTYPLLGVVYFMIKAFIGYFVVIWVRATLPRIRIDHMLELNWKGLVPLALASIVVTMLVDKAVEPLNLLPLGRAIVLFAANVVVLWAALVLVGRTARRLRQAEAEKRAESGHGPGPDTHGPGGEHEPQAAHAEAHPAPAH